MCKNLRFSNLISLRTEQNSKHFNEVPFTFTFCEQRVGSWTSRSYSVIKLLGATKKWRKKNDWPRSTVQLSKFIFHS